MPNGTLYWVCTSALNATLWPEVDGFGLELRDVVVVALLMVCVRADEILFEKFVSPPYDA